MNNINRKKFFGLIGKGTLFAAIASAVPFKMFSSAANASDKKNIKIAIHPFAVKRNNKV